jgi:hypothetical protein
VRLILSKEIAGPAIEPAANHSLGNIVPALQHPLLDPGQRHIDCSYEEIEQVNSVAFPLEPLNEAQAGATRERCLKAKGNPTLREEVNFAENKSSGRTAAASGEKGDIPCAIRSALMEFLQLAYLGRNFRAKLVLPTPFGPAMI